MIRKKDGDESGISHTDVVVGSGWVDSVLALRSSVSIGGMCSLLMIVCFLWFDVVEIRWGQFANLFLKERGIEKGATRNDLLSFKRSLSQSQTVCVKRVIACSFMHFRFSKADHPMEKTNRIKLPLAGLRVAIERLLVGAPQAVIAMRHRSANLVSEWIALPGD